MSSSTAESLTSSQTKSCSVESFYDISTQRAASIFWLFAVLWFLIWSGIPALLLPSPGTYDVIEQYIISGEWVLGSSHHPPLPFWILEICYQLCGESIISSFLCGAFFSVLGLWAVWRLSRYYFTETQALLVVLASAAYRYFNMGNVNFTTSVPPTALWCLSIFLLFRAIKYDRGRDWMGVGFSLGAGMMSKYSIGILILTMLLYFCWERDVRRLWKTSAPWIMTFSALLVFLPHLIWMIYYNFPTVRFASSALSGDQTALSHFTTPLIFLASQIFLFLPMLIPLIPLTGCAWQLKYRSLDPESPSFHEECFQRRFLNFMFLVPILIQLLIFALFAGRHMRPAFGAPLWVLTALWVLNSVQLRPGKAALKKTAILSLAILTVTVCAFIGDYTLRYYFTDKPCRAHFPGKALAAELDSIWAKESSHPCPYLSGDWKVAGHAALYMKNRPSVLCYYRGLEEGKQPHGFWVFDEDLAREGGMIVWKEGDGLPPDDVPEYLARRFPSAQVHTEIISVPWMTSANIPPLRVRYAVISPKKGAERLEMVP